MSALLRLAGATAEFASARSELDSALNGVVDHRDRHAVGALCANVQNVCMYVLPEVVRNQVLLTRREIALHERMPRPPVELTPQEHPDDWLAQTAEITQRWITEGGVEEQRAYWAQLEALHEEHQAVYGRFILGFKQVYFSIRALQDALYRVGITIADGSRPGSHASMKSALNNDMNPVRGLLGRDADDYFAWFSRWRDLRDGIKLGRGASIAGPGAQEPDANTDEYGMRLTRVGADGGLIVDMSRDATYVSDVAGALGHTAQVMTRICAAANTDEH